MAFVMGLIMHFMMRHTTTLAVHPRFSRSNPYVYYSPKPIKKQEKVEILKQKGENTAKIIKCSIFTHFNKIIEDINFEYLKNKKKGII